MRRAFADNAEFESTDDRRSKRADIILSDARRGMSYKVSAFTKMEGEQPLFYDLLPYYLVYHFAKYALLPYRLYSLNCYTFTSPSSPRRLLTIERDLLCSYHTFLPTPILPSSSSSMNIEERGETRRNICDAYRSSHA